MLLKKTFSDTLLCVYKSLNLNIFSDLRKPGLVPGESLSLSTKIDSVLENNSSYIIISGWPRTKVELHINIRPYWSYRDDLAVIDGVVMKGGCIIVPQELKQQVLDQLHLNHMSVEKTKLLVCELVYWVNINSNIENHVKTVTHALNFSRHSPRRKYIMKYP